MTVTWNDSLAVGVPAIDSQHRELFARVAAFEDALVRGDARVMRETFAFLREYTLVHFAAEEQLMAKGEYPRAEEHRASHRGFVERLEGLSREQAEAGPSTFLALRTRNWIVVWLLDHVGGEDVALGRHLRARR